MIEYFTQMITGSLKDKSSGKPGAADDSDTEDSDDDIQVIEPSTGWMYVGSHNFTPSAWGTLSGSSFNPIINVILVGLFLSSHSG